jgi:uncharacterized membrane protein YeaQ/YmgE (transglycosylase-associated protein family)
MSRLFPEEPPVLTSIVGWILFGLVAGAVARMLHPGPDALGWMGTILLGITGSLLGGGVAYLLGYATSPSQGAGWILSIVGALALLTVAGYTRRVQRTV